MKNDQSALSFESPTKKQKQKQISMRDRSSKQQILEDDVSTLFRLFIMISRVEQLSKRVKKEQ